MASLSAQAAQACYKASNPSDITTCFNKSGMYPMNKDALRDDVFILFAPTEQILDNDESEQ